MSLLNMPVLFLVFNRLEVTKQVFAQIAQAKPPRLYIACDGARASKEGEEQTVNEVRNYILSNIDWECEVKTLFRERNLGCGKAVSEGISWFFEHEPMGIILEDDCLPSQSFFRFCQELLVKYKSDKRIWQIAGYSMLKPGELDYADYYYAQITLIWGWATWADRWQDFDLYMRRYPKFFKLGFLKSLLGTYRLRVWHKQLFDANVGLHDTWDCQWYFLSIINHGMSITPKISMVQNLGISHKDAAHPISEDKISTKIMANNVDFPLKHPEFLCIDSELDTIHYKWRTRHGVFLKIITNPLRWADNRWFNKKLINTYKRIFSK